MTIMFSVVSFNCTHSLVGVMVFFTPHPLSSTHSVICPCQFSDIELNEVLGEFHCVTTTYDYGLFRAYI